jgi:predicted GTPase
MIVTASQLTEGKRLKIIDAPGLDQSDDADKDHIRKMIKSVKDTTCYVKLFVLIINGATRGECQSTTDTIQIF